MTKRRKDSKNRVLKDGEYEKKNGRYEYRWTSKDGKRHSLYSPTLEGLREKENEMQKDKLDGIKIEGKKLTLNDIYHIWEKLKRGLKANTFQNYKYMYNQFVEPSLGKYRISDIRRSDVRAFYNTLSDVHNLKTSTIDSIHTVVHQVFQIAVEDDYIRYNPSDNALKELKKAHNNDSEKRRALTLPEQKLFEDFLHSSEQYGRWCPLFTVMLWTGMRVGELTGLRWCDIDFENNTISVNHTLVYFSRGNSSGMRFAVNTPKTEAGKRIIPMLPKVREALLAEKEFQKECGIGCNVIIDGYTDFIFINRFGGVQHQGTLNKALSRIIRDCNYDVIDGTIKSKVTLPSFSNHSLRHTFTTRMCEAGVNIKVMQEVLGHADAETTMDIYADATSEFSHSEMSRFGKFFKMQVS